jgi:hypothetical protein
VPPGRLTRASSGLPLASIRMKVKLWPSGLNPQNAEPTLASEGAIEGRFQSGWYTLDPDAVTRLRNALWSDWFLWSCIVSRTAPSGLKPIDPAGLVAEAQVSMVSELAQACTLGSGLVRSKSSIQSAPIVA